MLNKKKKKGLIRSYQLRYCKLYSHELQYFKKKDDKEAAGISKLAR